MSLGLIAKKIGMTRIFTENAQHVPVTVLEVKECQVLSIKDIATHGYKALQVGAFDAKPSRVTKSLRGIYTKANISPKKIVKEFRVSEVEGFSVGQSLTVDLFENGQIVDVVGQSIGKGFAGVMKRHNFGGLRASHGVSVSHRSHGSTGQRQDPGKVFKNKKMAGHLGDVRVTVQNLEIVSKDPVNNLIFVKGAVPGPNQSYLTINKAKKHH
jgi:large subunit ribosomal protein L3